MAKFELNNPHYLHKKNAFNCGSSTCSMCGNPRKFFGTKTLQEQREEQDTIDYLIEDYTYEY